MNTKRPLFILLITLALLGLQFSRALAKEVVKASIAGPGLAGEIELSDPEELKVASAPWFDLISASQPANLQNTGFYELHLEIGAPDEIGAINVFHYYPGGDDQPGYFFFAECQGCTGSFETWYRIRGQDDLALRQLLVKLGAPAALIGGAEQTATRLTSLSPSEPVGSSSLAPIFRQNSLLLGFLALLLLSLITFAFLRNRTSKSALDG